MTGKKKYSSLIVAIRYELFKDEPLLKVKEELAKLTDKDMDELREQFESEGLLEIAKGD